MKTLCLMQVKQVFRLAFLVLMVALSSGASTPAVAADYYCTQCDNPKTMKIVAKWQASEAASFGQKLSDWGQHLGLVSTIISWWTKIRETMSAIYDRYKEDFDTLKGLKLISRNLEHRSEMLLHRDERNSQVQTTLNGVETKAAAERAASEAASSAYCNNVTARKGPVVMYPFEIFIQNTIMAAMETLFLGAGADGNGPYYGAFAWMLGCPTTDPTDPRRNDPRTGVTELQPPAACMDQDEMFRGADITARIVSGEIVELMMPPFVDQEMTMPDGSSRTIKVPQVDESLLTSTGNDKEDVMAQEAFRGQKAFMAAWKYCVRAMGSRITPPVGDRMSTHEGVSFMGEWNHCASAQSTFIKACARMVAKHTKPNCGYSDGTITFDEICTQTALACDAAAALEPNLPFNCSGSMSAYEAEYASHAACFGKERLMATANGNKEEPYTNANGRCSKIHQKWQKQLAKEKKAFAEAQSNLQKMHDCWPKDTSNKAIDN